MQTAYSIEDIFEYMWSVEADRETIIDCKGVEELVLELKEIETDTKQEDF